MMDAIFPIRPYQKDDKAACMKAFKSNIPQYFATNEAAEFETFLDTYAIKKENKVESYRTYYFVILHNNEVVGCGGYGDRNADDLFTLTWGLVHHAFHKKGLGKILLDYRLHEFRAQFPIASLTLDTTQHTKGFFEKHGFVTTAITPDFYAPGMDRYDMKLSESYF